MKPLRLRARLNLYQNITDDSNSSISMPASNYNFL